MMYTVTFDLDGTLLRSPFWHLHLRPWLEQLSQRRNQSLMELWAPVRDAGDERWRHGDWVGAFDWTAMIASGLKERFPDPGTPRPEAVLDLCMPYVAETLKQLMDLPVRYAVVTNGFYRYQAPYLRALGGDRWLADVVTPDRAGTAKPDPRVFSHLGPVLCHVGDRPEHDAVAARRAGVVSVQCGPVAPTPERLDRMGRWVAPDIAIGDFRELPAVIRRLLNRAPIPRRWEVASP